MSSNIVQNSLHSWKTYKLKDLVNFLDGDRRPIKSSNRISGDYPYYGASGIVDYVHDYIFDGEYVLLGEDGENILSRNTRLVYHVKGKIWVNNHAHVLACLPHVNPIFLTEKLESLNYTNLNSGTAQPKLNKETCSNIVLTIPPLAEQKKIAQALTDVDHYISALQKLIEKKKLIKEGLMVNLLTGKQRLKEFAFNEDGTAKGYKDSELGKIPEDWDLYNLDEIADVIDPHPSHRAPPIDRDGIPFLGIGDFSTDGKIININPRLVNISVFEEHRGRYQLEDNLIGLGRVASIGKVIRLNANEKYSISPTLGIIRGTSVSNDLIFYLLSSRFVSLQFNRILSGSTRSSVGMNVLREVKIALPKSPKEQLALGTLLIDIDQDIQKLESKYQKSCNLKQGMMQKLLTGEIRLA